MYSVHLYRMYRCNFEPFRCYGSPCIINGCKVTKKKRQTKTRHCYSVTRETPATVKLTKQIIVRRHNWNTTGRRENTGIGVDRTHCASSIVYTELVIISPWSKITTGFPLAMELFLSQNHLAISLIRVIGSNQRCKSLILVGWFNRI